ncbi:uncharacterized protein [Henckelia pumila]|uniref:uncharacterized protein n=1 Tax=Henckelia pumila TaxID=405737 RepID=UPI003C6DCFBD
METLKFLLEGCARKWWRSTSAPIIAVQGVVTGAYFRTASHKLYFPPAHRKAKASELLSLKQGSMSIDEYQLKFFELLPYCPQISDSTEGPVPTSVYPRIFEYADFVHAWTRDMHPYMGPCEQLSEIMIRTKVLTHRLRELVLVLRLQYSRGHRDSRQEVPICDLVLLLSIPAFFLVDTGASQSFISARFVKHHKSPYIKLGVVISFSTPTGHYSLAKRLVVGFPLEFEGNVLMANLMKLVQFHPFGDDKWFFYGERAQPPMPLISALRPCRALESGGEDYLIYAIDLSIENVGIGDLPVVNEFPDVFLDEILGFSLVREVEFGIELMPETSSISQTPYHLAPSEMRELKNKLQDLLDK